MSIETKSYVPTFFNPSRGEYEPIHPKRVYAHASKNYPEWVCKRGCEETVPENFKGKKCPRCGGQLLRWMKYEEKR